MATTTASSGLVGSKRAMRRERRGGDADAEAPQAFKAIAVGSPWVAGDIWRNSSETGRFFPSSQFWGPS